MGNETGMDRRMMGRRIFFQENMWPPLGNYWNRVGLGVPWMFISLLIVAISYTTNCINVSQTHMTYARTVLFLVHITAVETMGIVKTICLSVYKLQ